MLSPNNKVSLCREIIQAILIKMITKYFLILTFKIYMILLNENFIFLHSYKGGAYYVNKNNARVIF